MISFSDLRKVCFRNATAYALPMLDAIERRAREDVDYEQKLLRWFEKGETVLLRDELCAPFRRFSFVDYYSSSVPLPFDNIWMAIDSAGLHLR